MSPAGIVHMGVIHAWDEVGASLPARDQGLTHTKALNVYTMKIISKTKSAAP